MDRPLMTIWLAVVSALTLFVLGLYSPTAPVDGSWPDGYKSFSSASGCKLIVGERLNRSEVRVYAVRSEEADDPARPYGLLHVGVVEDGRVMNDDDYRVAQWRRPGIVLHAPGTVVISVALTNSQNTLTKCRGTVAF